MKSKSTLPTMDDANPDFKKLTPAQKLFVKEFIMACGNATAAYRLAYPQATYSSARSLSSRLLRNVDVINAITAEYNKIWKGKDTEIEKCKTYLMIHSIGDSDISDVVDLENGTLEVKSLSEIPSKARQAIQSIRFHERETKSGVDRVLEVKMHPKLQALELRAKLQGMLDSKRDFTEDIVILPADREESVKRIQNIFNETID